MTAGNKICGRILTVLLLTVPLSAVQASQITLMGADAVEIPDSWTVMDFDRPSVRSKGNIPLFKATAPIMCVIRGTASGQSQSDKNFRATDIAFITKFYEDAARKKKAVLRFTRKPSFTEYKGHAAVTYEGDYLFKGRSYPVREMVVNAKNATYGFKLISPSYELHPFCVKEYEQILSTLRFKE